MTERIIDLDAELANPDLALVVDYAEENLEPERMAEVERRLETDPEFRAYAAPIIAVWTIRPVPPVPVHSRAELEAAWDDFTRRAGFVHQRARNRRRNALRLLVILLIAGAATVAARSVARVRAERAAAAERASYKVVPAGGQEIALAPGTAVKVAEGALVKVVPTTTRGAVDTLRVLGSATVRIVPDTLAALMRARAAQLTVKTLATVKLSDSLVAITATDTTPVAIYLPAASVTPGRRPADSLAGPGALRPSLTVVPGRPLVVSDTSTATVDPPTGTPKKKGKHYWTKTVAMFALLILSEVVIR